MRLGVALEAGGRNDKGIYRHDFDRRMIVDYDPNACEARIEKVLAYDNEIPEPLCDFLICEITPYGANGIDINTGFPIYMCYQGCRKQAKSLSSMNACDLNLIRGLDHPINKSSPYKTVFVNNANLQDSMVRSKEAKYFGEELYCYSTPLATAGRSSIMDTFPTV